MNNHHSLRLSIIVCTYNRAELIALCLEPLAAAVAQQPACELIVVDNQSTDATAHELVRLARRYPLRIVPEPRVGLSHARNRGWQSARADWVLYIDDDARIRPDTLPRALNYIENDTFAGIGGRIVHWFHFGRPAWFPANHGGNGEPVKDATEAVILRRDQHFFGGLMALRRLAIEEVGGFSPQYGMSGGKAGYSEEVELQLRLHDAGYKRKYEPAWQVDHLVMPDKLHLRWHIRSRFARGRDDVGIQTDRFTLVDLLRKGSRIALINTIKAVAKLLIRPAYYWQNALLDTVGKLAYAYGQYRGYREMKKRGINS